MPSSASSSTRSSWAERRCGPRRRARVSGRGPRPARTVAGPWDSSGRRRGRGRRPPAPAAARRRSWPDATSCSRSTISGCRPWNESSSTRFASGPGCERQVPHRADAVCRAGAAHGHDHPLRAGGQRRREGLGQRRRRQRIAGRLAFVLPRVHLEGDRARRAASPAAASTSVLAAAASSAGGGGRGEHVHRTVAGSRHRRDDDVAPIDR